jgi:hypothetical protein
MFRTASEGRLQLYPLSCPCARNASTNVPANAYVLYDKSAVLRGVTKWILKKQDMIKMTYDRNTWHTFVQTNHKSDPTKGREFLGHRNLLRTDSPQTSIL